MQRCLSAAVTTALLVLPLAAQSALHTIPGAATPSWAGQALVFAPDVDGDGVRDFAIGSPLEAPAGVVRVHSGRDGSVLRTLQGATPGAQFGFSLAIVNDLDGLGLPDLMIGAPGTSWSHANQGTAYVHSLETGTRWAQIFGSGTAARMGFAVANLGDIDGDGVDDFGAGEPGADHAGLVDCGAVVCVSGGTAQFLPTVRGTESGEQLGHSLARWGDLDGDGVDEWLAGAPYNSSHGIGGGRVVALSSGSNAPLASWFGGFAHEHFGMAVLGLGDPDLDGVLDFAVGAPDHSASAANAGRVVRIPGLAAQWIEEHIGAAGERVGSALALVDFDGDGVPELASGAPLRVDASAGRVGAVQFLHAASLVPGMTLLGTQVDGEFGGALGGAADLNGDGAQELLVGARVELAQRGVARVLGGTLPLASTYCTAKLTSSGCTPRISASGAASRSTGAGLAVRAFALTPGVSGMLFWGYAPRATPFHGGTLCVASPLRRTPVQQSTYGTAVCSGSFAHLFTPAALVQSGLDAGEHVFAQYWWRDSGFAAPENVGLSDALEFVVAP